MSFCVHEKGEQEVERGGAREVEKEGEGERER